MTTVVSSVLILLGIGPPFYWGTLGHGLSVPIGWALVLGMLFGLRTHWRPFGRRAVLLLTVSMVASLGLCLSLYFIGRLFSQPVS